MALFGTYIACVSKKYLKRTIFFLEIFILHLHCWVEVRQEKGEFILETASADTQHDDSQVKATLSKPVAVLCLDVGDKRIGVAVSESRVISTPLDPIIRKGRKQTLNDIEALLKKYKTRLCVLGLPYLESGEEGEQVEKTKAFARSLKRRVPDIEIQFEDERHSSKEAREILGTDNLPEGKLDSVAAAVILRDWLENIS